MQRFNLLGEDRQWRDVIDGRESKSALWEAIDWNKIKRSVNRLQTRIVKAVKAKDKEKVRSLQRLLARSFAGKLFAVKRVAENRGSRTPGVDNQLLDTPAKRWRQACRLNQVGYRPQPLKRDYVPKKNGKKRPLGIPTMQDRSEQALELLGLDPVSECLADGHSYGFRKGRSVQDAVDACFNALRGKGSAEWILEGDIKGCFDHISHEWMVEHIPTNKAKLKMWLKAGYLERRVFNPTERGTPQGGIISPALANMALDGLQNLLNQKFKKTDKIHMVRYADDFVITGKDRELLSDRVEPLVAQFLKYRGLELSSAKTRISHIADGFDFLGFNLRKYKDKLLIKPSKSNISAVKEKVKDICTANKAAKTDNLIGKLNPVLRGWANFYRHVVSQRTFDYLDSAIWDMTWKWAKRRHPKKSLRWIKHKYFQCKGNRKWVFCETTSKLELLSMSGVSIRRHVKVKSDANAYDPHWKNYFEKRSKGIAVGYPTVPYQCLSPVR